MIRFIASLFANVWIGLRGLIRGLLRPFRSRKPVAIWITLAGRVPHLRQRRARSWVMRLMRRSSARDDRVSSINTLLKDLEALQRDARVKGVVFELDDFHGPAASLSAVARQIALLKASGKKVYGFAKSATTDELRLLAHVDRLVLAPGGRLELVGYHAEVLSLNNALTRFGVRPQFVRRGEFKTAPEMFTRDGISPAQKATLDGILDERMGSLVAELSTGRKLTPEAARTAVDQGPYSAKRAIGAGLADGVAESHALVQEIETELGKGSRVVPYRAVEDIHLRQKIHWRPFRRAPYLALVPVHGIIALGEGRTGEVAGADSVVESLDEAADDPRARAVLLHIDSRGGSALASEVVHAAVSRVAKDKPVLAYFDQVAASGGYMIAVGAGQVWCAPEAIAGSIGVFAGKFDVGGLLKTVGVTADELGRGAHSGMGSLFRPWSEAELQVMEAEVEETYRDFLRIVAAGRKMQIEEVHAVGEGRVFTGTRALAQRLVDGTCGFAEAIRRAAELGSLPADAPLGLIDATPRVFSPLELLRGASREHLWMIDLLAGRL